MKRLMARAGGWLVLVSCVPFLASGSAMAYYKVWQDGLKASQPVTGYIAQNSISAICRTRTAQGDKACYGAGGNRLAVGDAAVHYVTSPTDPIAAWGSVVTTPKTITLRRHDGVNRVGNWFIVADTGPGSAWPASCCNEWLDIYAGDPFRDAPLYNQYYQQNLDTITSNFGSDPQNNYRFDLHYDVPPITTIMDQR